MGFHSGGHRKYGSGKWRILEGMHQIFKHFLRMSDLNFSFVRWGFRNNCSWINNMLLKFPEFLFFISTLALLLVRRRKMKFLYLNPCQWRSGWYFFGDKIWLNLLRLKIEMKKIELQVMIMITFVKLILDIYYYFLIIVI